MWSAVHLGSGAKQEDAKRLLTNLFRRMAAAFHVTVQLDKAQLDAGRRRAPSKFQLNMTKEVLPAVSPQSR